MDIWAPLPAVYKFCSISLKKLKNIKNIKLEIRQKWVKLKKKQNTIKKGQEEGEN